MVLCELHTSNPNKAALFSFISVVTVQKTPRWQTLGWEAFVSTAVETKSFQARGIHSVRIKLYFHFDFPISQQQTPY